MTDDDLKVLHQRLTDDGKLIEAGWVSLRILAISRDAGPTQLQEMRMAFMAGAEHLFRSIMFLLDDDTEPTAADLGRMDKIDSELTAYREELKAAMERGPQ